LAAGSPASATLADSRSESSTGNTGPLARWEPGEHVSVVGDTGTGKTFLISRLVRYRRYVVVLKTKADARGGWKEERKLWPGFIHAKSATAMDDLRHSRIFLEPDRTSRAEQARQGAAMLKRVWDQTAWTCVIDEHWYAEMIGLKTPIEQMDTQGRSLDITMIHGMQRPAQISRFVLSQSTHAFIFRLEGLDTKRIKESLSESIVPLMAQLKEYECVYFNRKRRLATIVNAQRLPALFGPYPNFGGSR